MAVTSDNDLRNFDEIGSEGDNDAKEWERFLKDSSDAFMAW